MMFYVCSLHYVFWADLTFLMVWKQRSGKEHVNIIMFYNKVFIPAVKPLLVELGPTGASTITNRIPEINNNKDGMPV